jgi:hypothetical protein
MCFSAAGGVAAAAEPLLRRRRINDIIKILWLFIYKPSTFMLTKIMYLIG